MRRLALLALTLVVLTACARLGGGGAGSQDPGGTSGVERSDLAGAWQLVRGTGPDGEIRVPSGAHVTIAFEGDRVSGQACNMYGGTYRLGEDGQLTLTAMGMTEMACQEPLMSLEAAYHAALAMVSKAAVADDRLTLEGDGVELVFDRQPPVADAALVGTFWNLETLIQGETASSVSGKAWLVLNPDGTLSGSTGCRDFSASYLLGGRRLTVERLINTDIACKPDVAAQDDLVLRVLSAGPAIEIDGEQLTLTAAGDAGLGYRVAER